MNIHAKNSDARKVASPDTGSKITPNIPLGEAYSAYWNWWLMQCAAEARQRYPDIFGKRVDRDLSPTQSLKTIGQLYFAHGDGAVFNLARSLGKLPGFDVTSFLLGSARSLPELVTRWSRLITMQSAIRFQSIEHQTAFIRLEDPNTVVLSPYKVRPANQRIFGPAMLAGVTSGTLERIGLSIEEIWSINAEGVSRPLGRFSKNKKAAIGFDSDIVIVVGPGSGSANTKLRSSNMQSVLSLGYLAQRPVDPRTLRLIRNIVALLQNTCGEHPCLGTTAKQLGFSERSLSRRLSEAGLAYGRLARFVRLRQATQLISSGACSLEEIAFLVAYSDRPHMAREFRKMAQVTPAGLRDLFHS